MRSRSADGSTYESLKQRESRGQKDRGRERAGDRKTEAGREQGTERQRQGESRGQKDRGRERAGDRNRGVRLGVRPPVDVAWPSQHIMMFYSLTNGEMRLNLPAHHQHLLLSHSPLHVCVGGGGFFVCVCVCVCLTLDVLLLGDLKRLSGQRLEVLVWRQSTFCKLKFDTQPH